VKLDFFYSFLNKNKKQMFLFVYMCKIAPSPYPFQEKKIVSRYNYIKKLIAVDAVLRVRRILSYFIT
jgi:hypothetical protein